MTVTGTSIFLYFMFLVRFLAGRQSGQHTARKEVRLGGTHQKDPFGNRNHYPTPRKRKMYGKSIFAHHILKRYTCTYRYKVQSYLSDYLAPEKAPHTASA